MSDWVILRFPFDQPDKPEVVEVLANVPLNWNKFLKEKAIRLKKEGRYIVANLLYGKEYYYPESKKQQQQKVEKDSQ